MVLHAILPHTGLSQMGFEKRASVGLGSVLGLFLAFNLPFILADSALWLTSILAPMRDSLFPQGVGLVTLLYAGLPGFSSAALFTVLEVLALLGGIIWYFFNARKYPQSALLLAVLPLFFAWRSLAVYFDFVAIIMLAGMFVHERNMDLGLRLAPSI